MMKVNFAIDLFGVYSKPLNPSLGPMHKFNQIQNGARNENWEWNWDLSEKYYQLRDLNWSKYWDEKFLSWCLFGHGLLKPRDKILSFVPHYQKKYPWAQLELVPEVTVQNGDIPKLMSLTSCTSCWLVDIRGSINQERVEFWLLEQVPTDSVPRGSSSGSEE